MVKKKGKKLERRNTRRCAHSICRESLASHVDSFIFHTTYAPLLIPSHARHKYPHDHGHVGLKALVDECVEKEISGKLQVPSFAEFLSSVKVKLDPKLTKWVTNHKDMLVGIQNCIEVAARDEYNAFVQAARAKIIEQLEKDNRSILSAADGADLLGRIANMYRKKNDLFDKNYQKIDVSKPRNCPAADLLTPFNNLGFIYLERTRIRPIGYTLERAPFYELSLQPGEVVTLRQKSFSKRAVTLEEATEEMEERRLEYSSTFTTELAQEYSKSVTDASNWGVSSTVSGGFNAPGGWHIGGQSSGYYGASHTETTSSREASGKAKELSRKVETSQKTSHKTVVTIAKEDIIEEESIKVIRNDDVRAKKILMRKLMQVLHLSYERYGVRMCWAPCIQDPGRDVRGLVPGPDSFPREIQTIKEKYATQTPPPELVGPAPEIVVSTYPKNGYMVIPKGGTTYRSEVFSIPNGYEYLKAELDTRRKNGTPWDALGEITAIEKSTGTVTVKYKLVSDPLGFESVGIGAYDWKGTYRISVTFTPTSAMQTYQNAINAWRDAQAEQEIQDLLTKKRTEVAELDPEAWPVSELMRRVMSEYFNIDKVNMQCNQVAMLQHVFEWENLSATLYAQWWASAKPIDNLQSLKTSFLNASWARVYIPIRPGFEEEAITYLIAIGAIPKNQDFKDVLEYYIKDMHINVEPMFAREYEPKASDTEDIRGPCDILLTTLGTAKWDRLFEAEAKFKVLDRFIATIPTDGVDYEEQLARCDISTPTSKARESSAVTDLKVKEAIAKRLAKGDGEINVDVSE